MKAMGLLRNDKAIMRTLEGSKIIDFRSIRLRARKGENQERCILRFRVIRRGNEKSYREKRVSLKIRTARSILVEESHSNQFTRANISKNLL